MTRALLAVSYGLLLALSACATRAPDAPRPASATPSPAPVAAPLMSSDPTASVPAGAAGAGTVAALDPCSDFDAYANAAWRAENPIPADQQRWGRRAAARETNRRQVEELLADLARADAPAGSDARLLGAAWASCMDEARAEALGVTPLAPLLAELDAIRSRAALARAVRHLHAIGVPVVFALTAVLDDHDPERTIASVVASGLGLSRREATPPDDAATAAARETFRAHVERLLVLGGTPADGAARASRDVLALEARLAGASLDPAAAADPAATEHRLTPAQLDGLAPALGWKAYLASAGLPPQTVNVAEPELLRRLDTELRTTPLPVWRAYLRARLLDSAAPFLSRPFVEEAARSAGGDPVRASGPRARRCVEATEALFGETLGRAYVQRHFPPAARERARTLVASLLTVIKEDVAALSWMRPETRTLAAAKLDAFDAEVGYPDRWPDLPRPTLRRDALWTNVVEGRRVRVQAERRRMGRPTERSLWMLPASSPGAYIDLQLNQMVLPAGFLRSPAFSVDASDAENYGALGTAVAHDLLHGIDVGGSELDVHGRPRRWWTDDDRREFQARAACVSAQYEGYVLDPGGPHRGSLVLSEAVGDLAGLRVALTAFHRALARGASPAEDAAAADRRFFVAFARARGESLRPELQARLVRTDIHPLGRFRVIGPLVDTPEFAAAFSCPAGAPMVRPPERRCRVF